MSLLWCLNGQIHCRQSQVLIVVAKELFAVWVWEEITEGRKKTILPTQSRKVKLSLFKKCKLLDALNVESTQKYII